MQKNTHNNKVKERKTRKFWKKAVERVQNIVKKQGKRMLCGGVVGLANSLFGGGGGMLAVPLLTKGGMQEKQAHATAILVILPISLFSFILYAIRGFFDTEVLLSTAIGVTFGGLLGAKLLGKLPTKAVNLVFAFLQLAAGISLFFL